MNNIFSVDFNTSYDWRMEDLQEALKQIDEARKIVVAEIANWREERAKELTDEIASLIHTAGEEGYNLYLCDEVFMAYELRDEDYTPQIIIKDADRRI